VQLFAVTMFANCVGAYAVSSGGVEGDPIADLQARLSAVRYCSCCAIAWCIVTSLLLIGMTARLSTRRLYFFQNEAWLTLTWLLDHANRKIQQEARRFMEGLRTFGGVVADKFDDKGGPTTYVVWSLFQSAFSSPYSCSRTIRVHARHCVVSE
jgi:hypothetical protein